MPIALNPRSTFVYTPAEDKERPEAEQRRLTCQFGSQLLWEQFEAKYDEADARPSMLAQSRGFAEAIALVVVGVSVDELCAAFSPMELKYHAGELPIAATLTELDQKKSVWRPESPVAKSAPDAAPAHAST